MYGEIREGDDHEDEGEESKLDATIHAENVSHFVVINCISFKDFIVTIFSWINALVKNLLNKPKKKKICMHWISMLIGFNGVCLSFIVMLWHLKLKQQKYYLY